ncbi:hypothetical protein PAXRUDRAFT_836017 [Paxillus rubicundulus Ve08.2h10]|uniref:Uncharacterized protein n=1 Tax=Paxillus rubicundulus Ve08.2h10 TaxID=930991 RepID=A0A0D0DAM7_9AGAM|nr:hypothetical protein PAXRUDRAFT_836017 [Paxillus rubicundulus Ve08.2h10]
MDSNTFSFYSNVFGFVAGGISLILVVFGFCRTQLPSHKIKVLEELLDETQDLFSSYVEQGYLPQESIRANIERRLARLRDETFDLRSQVYRATTFAQDYTGFFAGLSLTIGRACSDVKRVRADIITKSEIERLERHDNALLLRALPFCERGLPQPSNVLLHQPGASLRPGEADVDPFVNPTDNIQATVSRRSSADNSYRAEDLCTEESTRHLAGEQTLRGEPASPLGTLHSGSCLTLNDGSELVTRVTG